MSKSSEIGKKAFKGKNPFRKKAADKMYPEGTKEEEAGESLDEELAEQKSGKGDRPFPFKKGK